MKSMLQRARLEDISKYYVKRLEREANSKDRGELPEGSLNQPVVVATRENRNFFRVDYIPLGSRIPIKCGVALSFYRGQIFYEVHAPEHTIFSALYPADQSDHSESRKAKFMKADEILVKYNLSPNEGFNNLPLIIATKTGTAIMFVDANLKRILNEGYMFPERLRLGEYYTAEELANESGYNKEFVLNTIKGNQRLFLSEDHEDGKRYLIGHHNAHLLARNARLSPVKTSRTLDSSEIFSSTEAYFTKGRNYPFSHISNMFGLPINRLQKLKESGKLEWTRVGKKDKIPSGSIARVYCEFTGKDLSDVLLDKTDPRIVSLERDKIEAYLTKRLVFKSQEDIPSIDKDWLYTLAEFKKNVLRMPLCPMAKINGLIEQGYISEAGHGWITGLSILSLISRFGSVLDKSKPLMNTANIPSDGRVVLFDLQANLGVSEYELYTTLKGLGIEISLEGETPSVSKEQAEDITKAISRCLEDTRYA